MGNESILGTIALVLFAILGCLFGIASVLLEIRNELRCTNKKDSRNAG